MKKKKITAISLMLATAAVTATVGGSLLGKGIQASAADTYSVSDVFSTSQATITMTDVTVGEETKKATSFNFSDEGSVTLKRNLAYKWYEKKTDSKQGQASYFTFKFAFESLDFETVTFHMDATSAWATSENKATNSIRFRKTENGVVAYVFEGEEIEKADEDALIKDAYLVPVTQTGKEEITLTLEDNAVAGDAYDDGEFGVLLAVGGQATQKIGTLVNVGANYTEYAYNDTLPLKIKADLGENSAEGIADKKLVIVCKELNKQSFVGVTEDNKIEDTAAPVVVVNEAVDGFLLGTAFALDYTVVDVIKNSNLTKTLEYYQYNPSIATDAEAFEKYASLSTSTYFFPTSYTKEGETEATTVYKEYGSEFVSVKITVGDSTFNGTDKDKAVYDLAWYANAGRVNEDLSEKLLYIPVDRNEAGATYNSKFVTTDTIDDKKQTVLVDNFDEMQEVVDFKTALNKAAEDVYAGSNSYIYFPSFKWLIDDNNGYRNLKFTISYRAPGSESESTSSNLSYNSLKLSVEKEGKYEFKIFANDKAGNTMKCYLDDEEVSVSGSNVWDIEGIPSFSFEIKNKGLKVEDSSSSSGRAESEVLNKTFSLDSFTVVGATDLNEDYALYKIDLEKCSSVAVSDLSAITFDALAKELATYDYSKVTDGDYMSVYMQAYAKLLATRVGVDVNTLLNSGFFEKIGEAGDRINSEEKYEKYNWNASSKSFTTVEEGQYLILADFWEGGIPAQRATAYSVVVVESEEAVIKGETDWLKNNVASVVLFSIAGVMLILIIVLLLVKPSDETLADVDAKAEKKAKKAKKQD
ncbi:MAG: hypothetical protein E7381_05975 [Clostridiales bacterium]|nr:hypothetical protein [Clostridiales bacterium]